MNIVFVINGKILSPTEENDTILRGITKRSVLEVAKLWGYEIEERRITVEEVITAIKDGSCTEVFGAGTAATIAHIHKIGFRGEDFIIPAIETREFSLKIEKYMNDLKSGIIPDEFGWLLKA
jgi:branched-chain amino acid aminotransferase